MKLKFRYNFLASLYPFCNCGYLMKQIFTSFSTAKIPQIKEKLFPTKLATSNVLCWTKMCKYSRDSTFWIEWSWWWRECFDNRINNRLHYNHGKVHSSIVMNPFKKITTSPKISNWFWITLCHTLNWLVVSSLAFIYTHI